MELKKHTQKYYRIYVCIFIIFLILFFLIQDFNHSEDIEKTTIGLVITEENGTTIMIIFIFDEDVFDIYDIDSFCNKYDKQCFLSISNIINSYHEIFYDNIDNMHENTILIDNITIKTVSSMYIYTRVINDTLLFYK